MSRLFPRPENAEPELDISSLIDCSFLLLIYFLITSSIDPVETDLGMKLPRDPTDGRAVPLHDLTVQISPEGHILLNDEVLETDGSKHSLPLLRERLNQYIEVSKIVQSECLIVIAADDASQSQRFVDVLNTVAEAGIESVTISGFKED